MSEAPSAQQRAHRQQALEELCAAAVRALSGDAQLHYRAGRLHRADTPLIVRAPHLQTDPAHDGLTDYRGSVDGTALRLTRSSAALHAQLIPADPVERLFFELLEQLRVETQVPPTLTGMRYNLGMRFTTWAQRFIDSGMTESSLGLLIFTVAQSCWSRLNGAAPSEKAEDIMEATRAGLSTVLGAPLAQLVRTRHDQAAFAPHALRIAGIVAQMIRDAQQDAQDAGGGGARDEATIRALAMLLEFEADLEQSFALAPTGESRHFEADQRRYRVFTRKYDREARAADLVRGAELKALRQHLDEALGGHAVNVERLTRRFFALLAQPHADGMRFGQDEGHIDGARLAQLVASPDRTAVFRQPLTRPHTQCAVSFLIDCSGSMKATIEALAVLIDVLVRALSQAGVRTEVLGFTTAAWSGGRAQRDWLAQGRPAMPGRLNETLHLVFKDAARSWRRARADIAALLKPDLFREGVDGEAVEWACSRLASQCDVSRRILVVVSDGSPNDTATSLANDPHYLDNHLRDVVARHRRMGDVAIMGLGVGLDLSPYYDRSIAVDLSKPVGSAVLNEFVALIGGGHRR